MFAHNRSYRMAWISKLPLQLLFSVIYAYLLIAMSGLVDLAYAVSCADVVSSQTTYKYNETLYNFRYFNGKTYAVALSGVTSRTSLPDTFFAFDPNFTFEYINYGTDVVSLKKQIASGKYGAARPLAISDQSVKDFILKYYGSFLSSGGTLVDAWKEYGESTPFTTISGCTLPFTSWSTTPTTTASPSAVVMNASGGWSPTTSGTYPAQIVEFDGKLDCAIDPSEISTGGGTTTPDPMKDITSSDGPVCVVDQNGDGEITDTGEAAKCQTTPQGNLCPLDALNCNVPTCPSGYSYNAATRRCELSPRCSQGTFNSATNQCEWTTTSTYAATISTNGGINLDKPLYKNRDNCTDSAYYSTTCAPSGKMQCYDGAGDGNWYYHTYPGCTVVGYLASSSFNDATTLYLNRNNCTDSAYLSTTCAPSGEMQCYDGAGDGNWYDHTYPGCTVAGYLASSSFNDATTLYKNRNNCTDSAYFSTTCAPSGEMQCYDGAGDGNWYDHTYPGCTVVGYLASSASTYSCNAGDILSDATCTHQTLNQANPTCPSGTLDGTYDVCYVTVSCPYGDQYACMQNTSGVLQCSPNQCTDASDTAAGVEIEEFDEDYYQDDGERDEEGNCLGQLYIFNGKPSRCRPPGWKVGYINDCCADGDAMPEDVGSGVGTVAGAYNIYKGAKAAYAAYNAYNTVAASSNMGRAAAEVITDATVEGVSAATQLGVESGAMAAVSGGSQLGSMLSSGITSMGPSIAVYAAGAVAGALGGGQDTQMVASVAMALAMLSMGLMTGPQAVIGIVIIVAMRFIMGSGCDANDITTANDDASERCHYVGKYCQKKIFGACVQKAKGFCCFNSILARIIHEQGRPQLISFQPDGAWGSAKKPNCRGFTPEEFQSLDFAKIDLTEYYGYVLKNIDNRIQGAAERVSSTITTRFTQIQNAN